MMRNTLHTLGTCGVPVSVRYSPLSQVCEIFLRGGVAITGDHSVFPVRVIENRKVEVEIDNGLIS